MLLSSVNFVKTSRKTTEKTHFDFSDFILGKYKEETEKKSSYGCGKCGQLERKTKDSTTRSRRKESLSTVNDQKTIPKEEASTVTIETKDGYMLNLNPDRNSTYLGHEENATLSNVFRQNTFHVSAGEKEVLFCTFQLHSDTSKYLAVSPERKLEVQSTDSPVCPESPDGRFFIIHKLNCGSVFIQPHAHKGFYLHHLDNQLYLRKLEINWRPPEEYYFRICALDIPEADSPTLRYSEADDNYTEVTGNKKCIENILDEVPKPSLFWGCFGGKSRKIKRKLQQKILQTTKP